MTERFKVTRYEYTVDYEAADSVLDDTSEEQTDLRGALDALQSDYWDNLDQRETQVICYPADWQQDYRTGEVTHTDLVVTADRSENLDRLMAAYRASR